MTCVSIPSVIHFASVLSIKEKIMLKVRTLATLKLFESAMSDFSRSILCFRSISGLPEVVPSSLLIYFSVQEFVPDTPWKQLPNEPVGVDDAHQF